MVVDVDPGQSPRDDRRDPVFDVSLQDRNDGWSDGVLVEHHAVRSEHPVRLCSLDHLVRIVVVVLERGDTDGEVPFRFRCPVVT